MFLITETSNTGVTKIECNSLDTDIFDVKRDVHHVQVLEAKQKTPILWIIQEGKFISYYSHVGSIGRYGVTIFANQTVFKSIWPPRAFIHWSELIYDYVHTMNKPDIYA